MKVTAALSLAGVLGVAAAQVRTFDGTRNARNNLGAANRPQLRLTPGFAGTGRPNPRAISNAVFAQSRSIPNSRRMSELVTFFGQFIDHDVVLTPMNGSNFPIRVPAGDRDIDEEEIELRRSPQINGSPVNVITSFIDGSAVYGSDNARARALRTRRNGRLRVGPNNLLPDNTGGLRNEPDESAEFFVAGDIRANENPNLMVMHTLFMREHNRLAAEVRRAFPGFNDEQIFQTARRVNIGQIQKIVYNEWLPALLGSNTGIPAFRGFNPNVRPVVSAFFSTAAFRVGHTLLNNAVSRIDGSGNRRSPIRLRNTFMIPDLVRRNRIEVFLRGMANTPAQEVDTRIVDDVRNFLFTNIATKFPELNFLDLVARNIQRGRDHRIPTFNAARRVLGLPARTSFDQISSRADVRRALRSVYRRVQDIDGFVGALAEDRVRGSSFGPLLRASWASDFRRLRDGDRFFYLNNGQFSSAERSRLASVRRLFNNNVNTMRRVILDNTPITATQIPGNPFFVRR